MINCKLNAELAKNTNSMHNLSKNYSSLQNHKAIYDRTLHYYTYNAGFLAQLLFYMPIAIRNLYALAAGMIQLFDPAFSHIKFISNKIILSRDGTAQLSCTLQHNYPLS